jgi:Alw26I/Eco31I/Esp3I family type II restriction m6 adenine DNA methyltransferase
VNHVAVLETAERATFNGKDIQQRAAGRFYTHAAIGVRLASTIVPLVRGRDRLSLADPFGGDGRLVCWLLQELVGTGVEHVAATVWEQEAAMAPVIRERVGAEAARLGLDVEVDVWTGDTFDRAAGGRERFDVVVTNPPWELLKPDHREMKGLPAHVRDSYVAELRAFDRRLAGEFPTSQPSRRFAGWGTNLSRVGTEVALRLTGDGGVCGVVAPASLLADSTTAALRRWMLDEFALVDVTHWPAEARLFSSVDVPCLSFVGVRGAKPGPTRLTRVGADRAVENEGDVLLDTDWLSRRNFAVPVIYGAEGVRLLRKLDAHPTFASLEGRHNAGLWAGRELDETRRADFTVAAGKRRFVRSAHIHRLAQPALPANEFVDESERAVPGSAGKARLAWRDISRPSQKRRIHATLLPAGPVTGNSVSVAHFRDGDHSRLLALLGFVSSMPFELQVRSLLMTNHVSLSVMRAGRLPLLDGAAATRVAEATRACLKGEHGAEAMLERAAADAYGLDRDTWSCIADMFQFDPAERRAFDEAWRS